MQNYLQPAIVFYNDFYKFIATWCYYMASYVCAIFV